MFSADLEFYRQSEMSVRDEIVDDFSTDEETIETLNSTSRPYGEATGARPKTGNQSGKPGHYTKETEDRKFKKELRIKGKKRRKNAYYKEWKINHLNEVGTMIKAKMEMFRTKANEIERKRAWSARRAAKHSRLRNREKIKIPTPPGEDDKSSETYYTSTTELSDTSSDSIPEIIDSET